MLDVGAGKAHLGTYTGTVNQIPPDDGLSRRGSDVSEAF